MKKKYKQLLQEQRYQIETLLVIDKSKTEIAALMGVHKSTITRELKRSIGTRGRNADQRHGTKNKNVQLTDALKKQAADWLRVEQLSPELIAIKWRCMEIEGVSLECLYQWIWDCKKSHRREDIQYKDFYKYLRHGRRRQKIGNYKDSRGVISNRTPLSERPAIVEQRKRIGAIEVDLLMGKDHKSALLVLTDRTTLVTTLDKMEGKDSQVIGDIIENRIKRIGSSWIKTMTFYNGKEFSKHG